MSDAPEADRIAGWPHPRDAHRLLGRAEQVGALERALASGRMPHAWLFAGPRGVGKATLAYRLAKHLLTGGRGPGLAVDPASPAARRFAARSHPDLLVVRRPYDEKAKKLKLEIPVDEVRDVGAFFSRHAAEGGWRIAIVDSADDLNRNAANALLKILEEPPARSLLILVAHAPHGLLPTIRSRCRRLAFGPLSDDDVRSGLGPAGEALGADVLRRILDLAAGSLGRACELVDGGASSMIAAFDRLSTGTSASSAEVHAFAEALARPAAERDYGLFLDLARARIARKARAGEAPAADAWSRTAALANAQDSLHIDRKFVVMDVLARLGALR